MNRLIIFILFLPLFAPGQKTKSLTESGLTKIYTQAIRDFIKEARKKNKTSFDTLYFGKHKNGQPDDFPDIKLPQTIENAHIILVSPETATVKQKERKSRIYINLIGWTDKEKAEFLFFVFSDGFNHQYNYSVNYKYNSQRKDFELTKLEFKGPPFDK